ncbi:MAG TPA: putative toxin-antitoxin system toxin component, PIN family [Mesotoga infera]|uniref:Toxin-antitoxin system toxin component, PIN family n=1 Tax=Mesotoga infera TaxID=1236046 RepID=A0A7C1CVD4_9BACT|nr:putative toxin-antitoxin system toxin component, PIN family [Mesotoga infera]
MKIVVDTNVLVAALINPYGSPAGVLNFILSNRVLPCFDARIIDEYERVLRRPRFGFRSDDIRALLDFFVRVGFLVTPEPVTLELPDLSHLPFVEVSRATNSPIVTGNAKHFPADFVTVLSPAALLEIVHRRA